MINPAFTSTALRWSCHPHGGTAGLTLSRLSHALLLSLSILGMSQVQAQSEFSLGSLQPGQLLLNLSVSEQKEVDQDTLNASLQFTAQGRNKTALQDEVNRTMRAALALLEGQDAVEFSTGSYHVYIVQAGRPTRNDIENPVWRAQQSVTLKSENSDALLELVGSLQSNGLELTGLHYSLSSARYERETADLLQAALEKLQRRADDAAAGLGKTRAELIEVNLNDGGNMAYFPREMMAMRASAADSGVSTPVAEPGKSLVNLNVSARALLSP